MPTTQRQVPRQRRVFQAKVELQNFREHLRQIPRTFETVNNSPTILRIDPTTGVRRLIRIRSSNDGIEIVHPTSISQAPNGDLLIADMESKQIIRFDPITRNASFLFEEAPPGKITGMAIAPDHSLIALTESSVFTAPLPPQQVSNGGSTETVSEPHWQRITARDFPLNPIAIDSTRNNRLVIVDTAQNAIIELDHHTGSSRLISGRSRGSGPEFERPNAVAAINDVQAVVTDAALGRIFLVDLSNGNRSVISGSGIGSGPQLIAPNAIATESNESILVVDSVQDAVIRVNTRTGERTLISQDGSAFGPDLNEPIGIVVSSDGTIFVINSPVLKFSIADSSGDISTTGNGVGIFSNARGRIGGFGGGRGGFLAAAAGRSRSTASTSSAQSPTTPGSNPTPIPEPPSLSLILLAAVGLFLNQRIRRASRNR